MLIQSQTQQYYDDPRGTSFEQRGAFLFSTHGIQAIHPGQEALPQGEGYREFVLPMCNTAGEPVYARCHCSVFVHRNPATGQFWQKMTCSYEGLTAPNSGALAYENGKRKK